MDVVKQILSRDENRLLQTALSGDEPIVPDGPKFLDFDVSDPPEEGSEVERNLLLEVVWPGEVRKYIDIPSMKI